jgi:hypothetical protein
MRPGQVTTDEQAFRQILARLEGEVGAILALVGQSKLQGWFRDTAPFWALMRMLFPIAESIGGLIYADTSTAKNLKSVLDHECEAVRAGYRGKANILAVLYRHSLTHQDEVRALLTGGKEVVWAISYGDADHHLEVKNCPRGVVLQFDTSGFYEDLLQVCKMAAPKPWGGVVKSRYNEWMALDLDTKANKYSDTISEITALVRSVSS